MDDLKTPQINDPVYTALFILIKHRGKIETDQLELKLSYLYNLSFQEVRRWLGMMLNRGLIHIEKEYTEEYIRCLEEVKENKRIKNKESYCGRKYPNPNIIMITSRGLVYYIDKYIKLCIGLGNDESFCYTDIHNWLCKLANYRDCNQIQQLVLCRHKTIRDRYEKECKEAWAWAESLYREYTNIVNT